MEGFRRATRGWFAETFEAATDVQRRGWAAIASGKHALLAAPTGSGKTLAAFLWALDRLVGEEGERPGGVRVLYVSPLKALVHDVERNLRAPLAGLLRAAERLGEPARAVRVDVRTGDTPQRDRARQRRDPAEVLVTTPESLFLLLGGAARETLRGVATVIVDEVHAVAGSKRGAHLALSLERLSELVREAGGDDPQRVGLSATVRPLDAVARFLGGDRPVDVVDASERPKLDLEVVVPVPDMEHVPPPELPGGPILSELHHHQMGAVSGERGIWPAIYPELVALIRAHRSTLVFVNSRGLCERLARRLNDLAGEELALAHHGSVSHERRAAVEDGLKRGALRAIVATSSLELGIDMGAVDLVIQVESPGAVARGLQRVGRAGHRVGETSRGRIFPKFRGDLLEATVVAERMLAGAIEALEVPENALDVLAQQVVAMCVDAPRERAWIERVCRRAHPYRELSPAALDSVLDMLSGRFPSGELADLRPRLAWDRARDVLTARRGAAIVSRTNAGTIPDRGAFGVHLGEGGPRVGELDEEMVFETREGDVLLLGASSWRVESIGTDRVLVTPAPGEGGRLPFWKGDGPGRPLELGRALGALVRELEDLPPAAVARRLRERAPLSEHAAANLAAYLREEREAAGAAPTDRRVVVQRFRDELGDWRVCVLTPFGSRVHAPWAMAVEARLRERTGVQAQVMYADDGLVLRIADAEEDGALPDDELLLPDPDEVQDLVTAQLADTSLFAALFRENAARALLVPRRRPDQRRPLWLQRRKARELLASVKGVASFPIVLETYRQALSDVFDLEGLREVLRGIRAREIRVHSVETASPSPFARSLVFAYVAQYLYDGDTPLAERRAQALALDRGLLAELLGHAELRELLDAEALREVEEELQGLAPGRRARDADELHDLLRRVGDLSEDEARARCAPERDREIDAGLDGAPGEGEERAEAAALEEARERLARLEDERRAARVRVGGAERWIAAADAGLYRDALGCAPPAGLPSDCLATVPDAFAALVARYARTHGPFGARDVAARYGVAEERVVPVLRAREREGALLSGELRPGGSGLEWCDAEVLRRIKRRTLARLRREVAPVDGAALARFLPEWQGVGSTSRAPGRLEEVVRQLQGVALPWSTWGDEVLPRRVAGFRPEDLDRLCAEGRVVWVGRGARGARDGDVALYLREDAALLVDAPGAPGAPAPAPHDGDALAAELRRLLVATLERRGASFLTELERALRAERPDVPARELEAALWDLVWAGAVTNDTFQPLRALRGARPAPAGAGRSRGARATLSGGRWWLVRELVEPPPAETERALARATALLERYGVASREAARAEALAGGFGGVYRVLRALEDAGRAQRGWFVEGLSGAQFALPGAVERLRGARSAAEGGGEPRALALAANDPANPFGALLPWPELASGDGAGERRPKRVAGALVVQVDGRPVLYAPPARRHLATFRGGAAELARALAALREHPRRGRKLLVVETIDGVPAEEGPHAAALEAAGFARDYRGYSPRAS